ncbi:MAG: GatB/YqeY domain-containing protein [Oscillospiraceae bacterium]|nr:GatB/YqeY domain-containing protein [Oscillospiraceae bacterium]
MEFKKLQSDMVAAMKAKDKQRKEAISNLIAAVKKVAIDEGVRENIPDDLVDRVILKELKSAKEQLDTCPDSRQDLKSEYEFNCNVISEYAPKQMSEAEIEEFIRREAAEYVAAKNKGMIMKTVMGKLSGKADGKLISAVADRLCK